MASQRTYWHCGLWFFSTFFTTLFVKIDVTENGLARSDATFLKIPKLFLSIRFDILIVNSKVALPPLITRGGMRLSPRPERLPQRGMRLSQWPERLARRGMPLSP
jgi:hypothetical protein